MATFVLTDPKIYFTDQIISDYAKSLTLDYGVEAVDDTVFGKTTRTMTGGLFTISASVEGNTNYAEPDLTFFDGIGSAGVFTATDEGGDDGDLAYTFNSLLSTLSPVGGTVGDMAGFSIGNSPRSPLVRGTILHPGETSRTSSSTGTGRQLGAVTASQSVYAALHVTSGSGGNLDVIVESDDNAGFTSDTDQITFTTATGPTSEWMSAGGAITDDYWRVRYTISAGTWQFMVVVGIV